MKKQDQRIASVSSQLSYRQRGAFRVLLFLFLLIGAVALMLVALKGWKVVFSRYFERGLPQIAIDDQQPRGIGISPVSMVFTVTDLGTGLDEVVVRMYQRSGSRELLRRSLKGDPKADISIDFLGEKSGLDEGPLRLEIKAFDRSFWSNSAEKTIEMNVDFRKPRVEPVTIMHNARRGGSQLAVFRATDAALAACGVRVGNQTFLAFPARELDPAFADPNIYAVLYAIDIRAAESSPVVRLFAQDAVGNATSASFPNRILPRAERTQVVPVTEEFLRGPIAAMALENREVITSFASAMGRSGEVAVEEEASDREMSDFSLVNSFLRVLSEQKLTSLLRRTGKAMPNWGGSFVQQSGAINASFGDMLSYRNGAKVLGTARQLGFDILMPKGASVVSAADGKVLFSENLGTYGNVLGIDHGFGLVSVYGRLETSAVMPGTLVRAGQMIGVAGRTGFARANQVYFELRVQGVPVDPREWWDAAWVSGHISDQIVSAKKLLEIPER